MIDVIGPAEPPKHTRKINGIIYFFDKDGWGYPVRCEKDHRIDEWVNQDTGIHTFHCAKCQKKFDIIEPRKKQQA